MKTAILYDYFLKCNSITTDSRSIKEGSMFFALKGENFNANTFVLEAIQKGCMYAVIDEKEYSIPDKTFLVDDALISLQELANYHRNKLQLPVIAITGTNGKTTTKELISIILQSKYKVCATKGNLNNHIGMPLTLLSASKDDDIIVIEMGANHIREIEFLCKIAQPDYGIITNIGNAHLEGFGSFEGIKKAKNELYQFLTNNNKPVFIHSGDETLRNLLGPYKNIIPYGYGSHSIVDGEMRKVFPFLEMVIRSPRQLFPGEKHLKTRLSGGYNASNILAAICIGLKFEVNIDTIIQAIESWVPANNRSQFIEKTHLNNQLLLDCYNANPTSMKAALTSFSSIPSSRKVLIIGEMLELGNQSEYEHEKLLEQIKIMKPFRTILVGKVFEKVVKPSQDCNIFSNSSEAYSHLKNKPIRDSLILVKGSRGIKLEKLIPVL